MGRRGVVLAAVAVLIAGIGVFVVSSSTDDQAEVAGAADTSSTTTAPTTGVPSTGAVTETPTSTTAAPAPTTTTAPPAPAYASSARAVTAEELGSSYTPGRGCAEPAGLRMLTLRHWGYDGAVHEGHLVVAAGEVERIDAAFAELFALRFPIERMEPVDAYGADDQASMRANNTSAYNCRTVAGTSRLSNHALGTAVDINPLYNPYVRGSTVDPPEGRPWADRSRRDPGMLRPGEGVVEAFEAQGWRWGGYWSNPDYQHFSVSGT